MTNSEQLQLALEARLIKSSSLGAAGKLLGQGFAHSGKRIASGLTRVKGYGNQLLGKISGNTERAAQGAQQVSDAAQTKFWGGASAGAGTGQHFGNTFAGRMGERAVYGAGRIPALATYGSAYALAPWAIGDYAGAAVGARNAAPNLQNHAYDEAAKFFDQWQNTGALQRLQHAWDPATFAGGMVSSSPHAADAYRRMYDPSFRPQGAGQVVGEIGNNLMPLLGMFGGGGDGRNFIQRGAAQRMADAGSNFFKQSREYNMRQTDMIKVAMGAGLAGAGIKSLAQFGAKKAPSLFSKFKNGAGKISGPAMMAATPALLYGSYQGSKKTTEQDMYSQARGTARAGMANYWQNMNPMQRFGAAIFPTAARMRAESQLGSGYQDFYKRYYGGGNMDQQTQQQIPPQAQQYTRSY